MARKVMTMERYQEIQRLLALKVSIRDIARSMKCARRTIREIRDGLKVQPGLPVSIPGPVWAAQIDWQEVMSEMLAGHPLKYIWEEKAHEKVSYVNFWKQFHRQFPGYKKATVVHRLFEAGERCEVDYAGKTLDWIDLKTGQVHEAVVFVGALGFSQLIFAYAQENAQSRNFLACHNKMYTYFGGVPKVTVPDCLKQGVSKCRIYDPDINRSYQDMAEHFQTAIVPARPRHPKDKAIVEGTVKLVMRYFKWRYRKHTFTSIQEINHALADVIERLNNKVHSRFKISRWERWRNTEKEKLLPLPTTPYEYIEWKDAKLHPDSHISVQHCCYSAPHIHRGKILKVKLTDRFVEIFCGLERVALHPRCRKKAGHHHTNIEHLPPNARASRRQSI
ncbi:MAG: IS21 family transposase [Planctomycetota bacterium]